MSGKSDATKLVEAIQHAEEVANECATSNPDCASDHRDLARWLKELQEYRYLEKFGRFRIGGSI